MASYSDTAEVRGMGFRPPAKAIIEALRPGAELKLVREPSNEYDPHAVQVWVEPSQVREEDHENLAIGLGGYGQTLETFLEAPQWFLGYVGKEWAQHVSPILAQPGVEYTAKLGFNAKGKPTAEIKVEAP